MMCMFSFCLILTIRRGQKAKACFGPLPRHNVGGIGSKGSPPPKRNKGTGFQIACELCLRSLAASARLSRQRQGISKAAHLTRGLSSVMGSARGKVWAAIGALGWGSQPLVLGGQHVGVFWRVPLICFKGEPTIWRVPSKTDTPVKIGRRRK